MVWMMIAVDTNILVAAHRRDHPFFERASTIVRELAEGQEAWGIPLHSLIEFYGKVTHKRIWVRPSTPAESWAQIEAWKKSPTLTLLSTSLQVLPLLRNICESHHVGGASIHDARIAATCLQHKVSVLLTFDRDFSRFSELRTRNPL